MAAPLHSGVAVITGAAGGIGAGLAREAVSRGMAVVLADCQGEALAERARELGDAAIFRVTDVREHDELEALAELAYARFGQVDLLFNNAGVLGSGRSWEMDAAAWQRIVDINLLGVVNGLRAFVPRLLAAGRPARIINTASVSGFFAAPMLSAYAASKAAVVSLTEALASELAAVSDRVTVSLLAPGPVRTAILDAPPRPETEALIDRMRSMNAERGADPDDYGRLIFEAVDRGEFWIVPQPEALDERLRARTAAILERRTPAGASKG